MPPSVPTSATSASTAFCSAAAALAPRESAASTSESVGRESAAARRSASRVLGRKLSEPFVHEFAQGLRDRQGRGGRDVAPRAEQCATYLEREERVATGGLVQPQHGRTRQADLQTAAQQLVQRLHAEPAEPQPVQALF